MKSWLLVLSAASLILLVVTVVSALRSGRAAPESTTSRSRPAPVVVERVASRFPSPSNDEALALVKRGLAIRDPARVKSVFRLGDADPLDAVAELARIQTESGGVAGMHWLSSVDANGLLLEAVLVTYEKEGRKHQRLALLTPDETGKWEVDFAAFARTTKPSWDEILGGSAAEAEVRVIAASDYYYNGVYRDESEWSCFGVASPDVPEVLRAYCRRGSAQETAMQRIIAPKGIAESNPGPRRVTLRLRREEGAEARQFTIDRVMAEDWVVAEPWYDERFE